MRRLVIGLTSLLVLVGAGVVVAYLFVFGPSLDRAASVAPADTAVYASVSLAPSAEQQRHIGELLALLPGFADQAALPMKIDDLSQRFLGSAGLDYGRDVAPWLGDEVAVALPSPASTTPLLIVAVRDEQAARDAIGRIAGSPAVPLSTESYQGITITRLSSSAGAGGSVAIVDQMLVASADQSAVIAAIDAAAGRRQSLADQSTFRSSMSSLPAERIGSVYVALAASAASVGPASLATGLSSLGLALVVEPDGLKIIGKMPVDASAAASARSALALVGEPASLTDWMPEGTQAELVYFGARQTFDAIVAQLGSVQGGEQISSTLAQLRAVATLGLGIDVDRDLLPLFDDEAAIAISSFDASMPQGQLLLRPSDPSAASGTLQRVTDSLKVHGAVISQATGAGTTITSIAVAQLGNLSYAVADGVIVAGLTANDVRAALEAHASGKTLGASSAYQAAFGRAGGRGGDELYVDGSRLTALIGTFVDLSGDARDMLTHLGALALAVPSHDNQIEIHAAVTVH